MNLKNYAKFSKNLSSITCPKEVKGEVVDFICEIMGKHGMFSFTDFVTILKEDYPEIDIHPIKLFDFITEIGYENKKVLSKMNQLEIKI